MIVRTGVLLGALLLAVAVAPAPAQDAAAARGERSILLDLGADPGIGIWKRHSDRVDRGLSLHLSLDHQDVDDADRQGAAVVVTPARKRYLGPRGTLSSYAYAGLPLSYAWSSQGGDGYDYDSQEFGIGVVGGWGLEWFPVEQVSVGGHIGGRVRVAHVRASQEYSDEFQQPDESDRGWGFGLTTLTSGIRVHLYF